MFNQNCAHISIIYWNICEITKYGGCIWSLLLTDVHKCCGVVWGCAVNKK